MIRNGVSRGVVNYARRSGVELSEDFVLHRVVPAQIVLENLGAVSPATGMTALPDNSAS